MFTFLSRLYRRIAHLEYLNIAKKKNKRRSDIRKAVKKQLNLLPRNLGILHIIIDKQADALTKLSKQECKNFLVIEQLYSQQQRMYMENSNIVEDRIV